MEDIIENNNVNNNEPMQLLDMYFKSIKFNQIRGAQGNIKLQIKHNFEFAKSNDKASIKCTISTFITSDDMRLNLEIQTVGIFKINCENELDQKFAQIMVGILYPQLRCQIQLITTQPGIMPIILPIMMPKVQLKENDTIFA